MEPITITNLADYSYLSQSRIAHMFTYNLHISVQKYINRKKMIYAHNLIKNGFKPTKVAISLGYDNYSTFYRLYKKYINANPQKKYRYKLKNQHHNAGFLLLV